LPNNLESSVIVLFDSVVGRLEQCEAVVNDRAALVSLIDDGLQLSVNIFVLAQGSDQRSSVEN
jgi:hypothetical protein